MSKLDNQGRLTIPSDLIKQVGWNVPNEIAICYDFASKTLSICESSNIVNKSVVAIRKTDYKGRFFLPKEILKLLGIDKNSNFLIFLENKEFIVKDM